MIREDDVRLSAALDRAVERSKHSTSPVVQVFTLMRLAAEMIRMQHERIVELEHTAESQARTLQDGIKFLEQFSKEAAENGDTPFGALFALHDAQAYLKSKVGSDGRN